MAELLQFIIHEGTPRPGCSSVVWLPHQPQSLGDFPSLLSSLGGSHPCSSWVTLWQPEILLHTEGSARALESRPDSVLHTSTDIRSSEKLLDLRREHLWSFRSSFVLQQGFKILNRARGLAGLSRPWDEERAPQNHPILQAELCQLGLSLAGYPGAAAGSKTRMK